MNHFIWSILLFFPAVALPPQPVNPPVKEEMTFKAYYGDDYIGTMVVSKAETAEGTDYRAVTDITVTYLVSVDLDFNYRALYRNGELALTAFEYARNQKLKERCAGQRRGNTFTTQRDDEQAAVPYASIEQSLMAAYFQEPTHESTIFSERWGENIPLQKLGNGHYKLTFPDGKESHMTYRNGLCTESKIVSGWGTIVFRR